MKKIIITIAFLLLGVYLANTLILSDGEGSLKNGAKTVVEHGVDEMKSVFTD